MYLNLCCCVSSSWLAGDSGGISSERTFDEVEEKVHTPDYQRESNFTVSEWHCSRAVFANAPFFWQIFNLTIFTIYVFFLVAGEFFVSSRVCAALQNLPLLHCWIIKNKKTKNEPAMAGNLNSSTLAQKSRRSETTKEKSSSHHICRAVHFVSNDHYTWLDSAGIT